MATTYDALRALRIPDSQQAYTEKDAILYALSLGMGSNPVDAAELLFVYEKNLRVLPTMGVVLAHPGFWPRDLNSGLDWVKIVHGGQDLVVHRPLPPSADVIGRSRIADIVDKGPGKGALIYYERQIIDRVSGDLLCTSVQTMFCRGDGGIGGPSKSAPAPHPIPQRAPDLAFDQTTLPQAALLYRLNGDVNPLHADPEVARKAGFDRPILQGLATFGVAARAILAGICGGDPTLLTHLSVRFTAPVYPGETLRTEIWRDGAVVSFIVRVPERKIVAIDNGRADLRD